MGSDFISAEGDRESDVELGLGRSVGFQKAEMFRDHIARADVPRYVSLALKSLQRFGALTQAQETEIRRLVTEAKIYWPGSELLCEGEPLDHARILLSGWAAKIRLLGDGRRQILSFLLPGDAFGLAARPCAVALSTTIALTPVVVASLPLVSDAIAGPDTSSGLGAIAWCLLRNEEACLLNQITRVGRQTAYERVANLLLEIYQRLKAVSFVQGNRYVLPLKQEMLADALGLSVVHTNRMLQRLRRNGLIEWNSSAINILQPDVLEGVADFHTAALVLSGATTPPARRSSEPNRNLPPFPDGTVPAQVSKKARHSYGVARAVNGTGRV